MRKKILYAIGLVAGCIALACSIILASTTFTTDTNSYYGREAIVHKLAVSIVPVHKDDPNDHNDVNSVGISDQPVYGDLHRITLAATGIDVNFTIDIKDDKGITLFSKTDCNTALLPLSYALTMADTSGNKHLGIPVAGLLTFDTDYVDPVNLTGITVTLYYYNQRY
jgi:hypothetical protein